MPNLMVKSGNRYRKATPAEIAEAHGSYVLGEINRRRPTLTAPREAANFLREAIGGRDYEVFVVILLDNRHRVLSVSEMFRGTIDGSSVHPREVVKAALFAGAAAVMFAHNHPSNVVEPSQADLLITRRLRDALALISVRVLDHLIVGIGGVTSLAERGEI